MNPEDVMTFRFHYSREDDVLYIRNENADVEEGVDVSEDVVLDLDKEGSVVGLEIFYASEFFGAFDVRVTRDFLAQLQEAGFEYRSFRNTWFIVVALHSAGEVVRQPMPPLRKVEYSGSVLVN